MSFAIQEIKCKKINVIASVSWTGFECIAISSLNSNGAVFWVFMDKLICNLKLKYGEYFEKIILKWDCVCYHLIKGIQDLLKFKEIMIVVTVPYTPEFSCIELFNNNIKNRFRAKLRKER